MKRFLQSILIFTLLLAALPGCGQGEDNTYYVTRVIDGDTIQLNTGEKVRLIGIDTPESSYNSKLERDAKRTGRDYKTIISMGEEAHRFTKGLAQGKMVRLEFDVEKRDIYGRLLAYVHLADGRMLNAEIIKEGYGQLYTFPPNVKYTDMFIKLQQEARESQRGLWAIEGLDPLEITE